ncbi:MAG: hypothetical protein AAGI38_05295 [Bacteroidota bacterium]
MENQEFTNWISHYVRNERTYHFIFPLYILNRYNGASNLDETLDDNLLYYILAPIATAQIEFNFELIWQDEHENPVEDTLDICVRVNDEKFDPQMVIANLEKNQMIAGLRLFKEEYNKLLRIY